MCVLVVWKKESDVFWGFRVEGKKKTKEKVKKDKVFWALSERERERERERESPPWVCIGGPSSLPLSALLTSSL